MKLIVDSHALIWYVDQDHLLTKPAHAAITDPANQLFLSAATIWEISIKTALGKLSLSQPFNSWMTKAMTDLGVSLLAITVEYADIQASLPFHHRDPFDRMIIAQAQAENSAIVSQDVAFDQYAVTRIW